MSVTKTQEIQMSVEEGQKQTELCLNIYVYKVVAITLFSPCSNIYTKINFSGKKHFQHVICSGTNSTWSEKIAIQIEYEFNNSYTG